MSEKKDPYSVPTTGHVWDETLAELLNQPPRWWWIGLHASWIFILVYTLIYPSWPLLHGHFKGLIGWTSIKEYKEDMREIESVRAKYEDKLKGMSAAAILANKELSEYAVDSAKVLFGDNCAACHGAGGSGNPGFPVLADDDWLYGGSIASIEQSITNGRRGMMPKMGGMKLTGPQISKLAGAIIAGKVTKEPLYTKKGCIGCHTPAGTGMAALGSANLMDSIWRFAPGTKESVSYTITHGVNDSSDPKTRNAEMPRFGGGKLSKIDIRKLAVYVYKLGGGQ